MPLALLLLMLQDPRWSTIENEQIRVGVDAARGGSIGYLADVATGRNIVNIHDGGRWIGQSYYSGPKPFGDPHPGWKDWPWNPVSAGDVHGHSSKILAHTNDGRNLYVKSIPKQWALKDVDADCTFETWIRLDGRAVHVRNRLTNARADAKSYPAFDQELPAVYAVGTLHRLFTYTGDAPFTGQTPRLVKNAGPPWERFDATEHWAALVDDAGWGLGVVHPGIVRWLGGFHHLPNTGGPADPSCGYLSPVRSEILDARQIYEYDYALLLDTLPRIQAWAVAQRPKTPFPDARFEKDRQHWTLRNATDVPVNGAWRISLEKDDPQLIGPEGFWRAVDVPKVYIGATFRTSHMDGRIYWSIRGEKGWSEERSLRVPLRPGPLEIELSRSPAYRGLITGLRFDPVPSGAPGDRMELNYFSSKPTGQ